MSLIFSNKKHARLFKVLEDKGYLTKGHFKEILKKNRVFGKPLTEIIFEESNKSAQEVLMVLADFFNLPTVTLKEKIISKQVLNLIPKELAEQHSVIIFKKVRDIIYFPLLIVRFVPLYKVKPKTKKVIFNLIKSFLSDY